MTSESAREPRGGGADVGVLGILGRGGVVDGGGVGDRWGIRERGGGVLVVFSRRRPRRWGSR